MKVIIAPLDWGLGHATRCIPVIKACLERNCDVTLVSSGRSLALLKNEFPALHTIHLPGYNIYYQKKGSFLWKIIKQLGKIFTGIRREHEAMKKIIVQLAPDLIISDNRYGLWSKHTRSVLISHQMMVKIPAFTILEPFVQWWLMQQHKKFHTVWIPDVPGNPNLSGDLGHVKNLPAHIKHIGLLTRFPKPEKQPACEHDVLALLSGPEPQRSIFEDKIIEQAKKINRKFLIISGISEKESDEMLTDTIRRISYCTADKLFEHINASSVIISRGGYSTLMDLAHLNKKCIFVPTPGQTEQEYLVQELQKKNLVYASSQQDFILADALLAAEKTNGFYISAAADMFTGALEDELSMIKN
jgi:predicted glycosyltransferase